MIRLSMTFQSRVRYATSRLSSVLLSPKPAVRRMNPNPSGSLRPLRMSRISRRRSGSSTLRETPT